MLDDLFDKLPYEQLEKIRFAHLLMGAAGVGVLLAVIYYFTLYSFGQEETTALLARKAEVEKKLKADEMLVAQTGTIARELALLVHDLTAVKRQMPMAEEMSRLLRKVSDSQKELGLEGLLFKVEEGKVSDYFKEIPVNIHVRGGFWRAVGFFDRLQNLLQAVTFADLKMETSTDDAKGGEKQEMNTMRKMARGIETPKTLPRKDKKKGETPELITQVMVRTFAYIEGSEDKGGGAPAAPPAAAPPPAPSAPHK